MYKGMAIADMQENKQNTRLADQICTVCSDLLEAIVRGVMVKSSDSGHCPARLYCEPSANVRQPHN